MYRCCIFDLDGTLINTLSALTYSTNLTLQEFGLGPVGTDEIKKFVGDGYKNQMRRALEHCGDKEPAHYEAALVSYLANFEKNCMFEVQAYDGIKELLAFLKENGIRIAVLSNKPHERTVENIEGVFGKGYFDIIVGEQAGIEKKPSPEGALMICEELGVEPGECLYLGDTNTDMRTGKAARMDTVGVTWGYRDREELESFHPEYVADGPREVIDIIIRQSEKTR